MVADLLSSRSTSILIPVSLRPFASNFASLGNPGASPPGKKVVSVCAVAATTYSGVIATPACCKAAPKAAASFQLATNGYLSAVFFTPVLLIILRLYVPSNPTSSHVPTASPRFGELSSSSQAVNIIIPPKKIDRPLINFDFI